MDVTLQSTRFGEITVSPEAIIDFPAGLIGLGGRRFALLARSEDSAFSWLHSMEDPALAVPVTDPWQFFDEFEIEVSDEEATRIGLTDPDDTSVYVTVRAAASLEDFCANLRAPLVVIDGVGHQIINQWPPAAVRTPLFSGLQEVEPTKAA